MEATQEKRANWLDQPLLSKITINWETVIFSGIIILAIISRFYDLESRVMSHDETSHVYFSWQLFKGQGFQHSPLLHGPFQFHLIALSYFLFGDNDLTARIPAVLASIATIAFVWNFRRYLGRAGTLVTAALFLISPFMLYYGRYVRNEALVALFGVIMLWAMLRYLETGGARYLYWLTIVTVLHFASKETSFIYTAQALIFLGLVFLYQVSRDRWKDANAKKIFFYFLIGTLALLTVVGVVVAFERVSPTISAEQPVEPAIPGEELEGAVIGLSSVNPLILVFGGLASLTFLLAFIFLLRGYGLPALRTQRAFGLMLLQLTLILPSLVAFPVLAMGWNPIDYGSPNNWWQITIFLVPLVLIATGMGLMWKPREWLVANAIYYGIFVIFYTTVFTNGGGFFTGLVGSLGYWLEQQGVERGSQPQYYYALIQVPIYEYLALLGSFLAAGLGIASWVKSKRSNPEVQAETESSEDVLLEGRGMVNHLNIDQMRRTALWMIAFWVVTSFIAYTLAGEKMPWLTVHIALPMLLLAGWALGRIIEGTDWQAVIQRRGLLAVLLMPVFLLGLLAAIGQVLGNNPPFQGSELLQLQSTSTFLLSLLTSLGSGLGIYYLLRDWPWGQVVKLVTLTFFGLLGVLTARTAILATYINYDYATEYLVYAHTANGPKEIMEQIEEISRRTTNGLAIEVAYDDVTSYPYWWYLRNYPNQRFYGSAPGRELRDYPIILVGDANFDKIEPIVGQAYYRFDYIRMWWPNQDYFGLTTDSLRETISNPEMRAAIFDIWLNRDYEAYSQVRGGDFSLPNWTPSAQMRMYVRKDVAASMWDYGIAPVEEVEADPYENKDIVLEADAFIGPGTGLFNQPRNLAVAEDGSIYVADSMNHRIVHLDQEGEMINSWGGSLSDSAGQFNEPWSLSIGPDGSIYVADTWNHRIQKFTSEGEFITNWGFFDQTQDQLAFWGPRDVAVDRDGNVIVTNTGNKRIAIFDENGNAISQFGGFGFQPGEFDEPVGLAVGPNGVLYVADTWNQRVQSFIPNGDGSYLTFNMWDINGWFGQSLNNKPYMTTDDEGNLYVADTEAVRVLVFDENGDFQYYWQDTSLGLISGIAYDGDGGIWVSDGTNNQLVHYTLP